MFVSVMHAYSQPNWATKNPFEQKNFIENAGQYDLSKEFPNQKILFEAYTEGVHYYLSNKGIILMRYLKPESTKKEKKAILRKGKIPEAEEKEFKYCPENKYELIEFEDANPDAEILLGEKVSNYYTYNNPTDKSGRTGIKASAYKTITYKNIYNHIDLVYEFLADTTGIKYSFILNPGANLSDIKLIFPKEVDLYVNDVGNVPPPINPSE